MNAAKARPAATRPAADTQDRNWTFLTNHAHVLLCISSDNPLTARELALRIGITERSVQAILTDLTDGGYLIKSKVGRCNVYELNRQGRLRHPLEASHTVGELIAALA